MISLPDVNVLLALAWSNHPHHEAFHEWFGQEAANGWATCIFLMGWATGGLAFGVLGDRIGRARTMLLTILVYSLCTGLSALSVGFWDFAFYRFLTGLGVGGEFAVGVALVAEVMPNAARPYALGTLQALSAVGNITAGVIGIFLGPVLLSVAYTLLTQFARTGAPVPAEAPAPPNAS